MKEPVLDNRIKEDVLTQIQDRASAYVPEWRYERTAEDPGAGLAELFAVLHTQTIDRFNSVPEKLRTEFYNLLGVTASGAQPSSGYVQFEVDDTVTDAVPVPLGTQLYAEAPDGDEDPNVIFETVRRVEAVSAHLLDCYYVDGEQALAQKLPSGGMMQRLFVPVEGENLLQHRFLCGEDEVLAVSCGCMVELELELQSRFMEPEWAQKLASAAFSKWNWYDGTAWIPFDRVESKGNRLLLHKDNLRTIQPDETGRRCIRCDIQSGAFGRLRAQALRLRTIPQGWVQANELFHNDVPIRQPEGGCCFGYRPTAYELFYLRSDTVLCKRGAEAVLRLDMTSLVHSDVEEGLQYQFGNHIIDKEDMVIIRPDDVSVAQVAWEYYNGSGWAPLTVSGTENPFSAKEKKVFEVRFQVPEDSTEGEVNAQRGWYIRARVVHMENEFSQKPRWLIPFVRKAELTYQYRTGRPVQYAAAVVGGDLTELADAQQLSALHLTLLDKTEQKGRYLYFRLDKNIRALPLSLLFQLCGAWRGGGKLLFEGWSGSRFEPLRAIDHTDGLRHTGTVQLYLTRDLTEKRLFGEDGFWLRLSCGGMTAQQSDGPLLAALLLNVVRCVQRQTMPEEVFTIGKYSAGQTLELLNPSILEAQVWVDEHTVIGRPELERLRQEHPERIQTEYEQGQLTRAWIQWKQVERLSICAPTERVYELDAINGVIRLGDGIHGRMPPEGWQIVRVQYACGGGRRGNLPEGGVRDFTGAVPRISALRSITPMSGGTDGGGTERVALSGAARVRCRGRAIGGVDYEMLVQERFPQVEHIRCFPRKNAQGGIEPGHICLVVAAAGSGGERTAMLCREIETFLENRCSCTLTESGRLHVVPALRMQVSVEAVVTLYDLDHGAETQDELVHRLDELVEQRWKRRAIGSQIQVSEVWQILRSVDNVSAVERVLVEGSYEQDGRVKSCALEGENQYPFAVVENGVHTIAIL